MAGNGWELSVSCPMHNTPVNAGNDWAGSEGTVTHDNELTETVLEDGLFAVRHEASTVLTESFVDGEGQCSEDVHGWIPSWYTHTIDRAATLQGENRQADKALRTNLFSD